MALPPGARKIAEKYCTMTYKLIFALLLFCTLGACQEEKSNSPAPEFTSLIGKWQLIYYTIDAVKLNGEAFFYLDEYKKNGNVLFWEFFDNGTMKATENNTSVGSNWELKVERLVGSNIDRGQLTLTGSYAEQVKTALELDALVYFIETSTEANTMNLAVEPKNLSGIYSTVTITYTYQKI